MLRGGGGGGGGRGSRAGGAIRARGGGVARLLRQVYLSCIDLVQHPAHAAEDHLEEGALVERVRAEIRVGHRVVRPLHRFPQRAHIRELRTQHNAVMNLWHEGIFTCNQLDAVCKPEAIAGTTPIFSTQYHRRQTTLVIFGR